MSESYLLPNERVLRYTFRERLIHWAAGFSYLYLLVTGLAFWSPWVFWLAILAGGATIARMLHPWAGLIFVAAVLWMYRMWGAQMRKTDLDRQWWQAVGKYTRNEDDAVPTSARFNGGQKLLFWGFFWCAIALLLSGLVLWFTASLPWSLRFLRYISIIVHPVAALLTIALFMIHVYMGVAAERGAFRSVIRGDVSRWFAQRYHRIWYDEIVRDSGSRK